MDAVTKRDTRGMEIKRLLQAKYPQATFQVRLEKYSMGERINISTDLLQEAAWTDEICRIDQAMRNHEDVSEGDYKALKAYQEQTVKNNEIHRQLKADVRAYEHVDRDERGEILSGGNTYVFIHRLAPKLILAHDPATGATIAQAA